MVAVHRLEFPVVSFFSLPRCYSLCEMSIFQCFSISLVIVDRQIQNVAFSACSGICAFYIKKASCPATWQDAPLHPHIIYPSHIICGCARTLSASRDCFKGTCIQFCLLLSRLLHEMSILFWGRIR